MRRRRNSSTSSSHSSATKSHWGYTPEQEEKLWEAFIVNIYPGRSRYADLAEELGLKGIVVQNFFKWKRGALFRRLTGAGQGDKVLKIQQAYNVSPKHYYRTFRDYSESIGEMNQWIERLGVPPRERRKKNKDLHEKLDEVEKMLNQKLEQLEKSTAKNKQVKQEHSVGQSEQNETVRSDVHLSTTQKQDHLILEQQQQQQYQQQQLSCFGQQLYYEQKQSRPSQVYKCRLAGQQSNHWGNTQSESCPFMPVFNTGYNGPHHLSSGAFCMPQDAGNTVGAPTPPRSLMNNATGKVPSAVEHQGGQNIGCSNYIRSTQHGVSTECDFTFPNQSQSSNFTQNHWPILYQNRDKIATLGQSSDSATNNGVLRPSVSMSSVNKFQYTSDPQYSGRSQGFNQGPSHYPTPDPSPSSHDISLPNFQTQWGLQCDRPAAMSPSQNCNTSPHPTYRGFSWDSSEGFSATKSGPSDRKLSSSCLFSHQKPSDFGNDMPQNQSFGFGPPPPPTPPLGSHPSVLASSHAVKPHQHLTHNTSTAQSIYTQPAGNGVRLWMAVGDSLSRTQGELTPDPNCPFTYYSHITGVQARERDNLGTAGSAVGASEEGEMCSVSQVLQDVNSVLEPCNDALKI